MPLVNPQENMEFLLDAQPGRRDRVDEEEERDRERATQMRDPLDIIGGLNERLRPVMDEMYQSDPLNPMEQRRMSNIEGELRGLQPVEMLQPGSVGSGRIQGNPYSVDTRGAMQGLSNLPLAIMNRRRADKRQPLEEAYGPLAQRQEQHQEAQEGRQDFMESFFPEMFRQSAIADRTGAQIESRENIAQNKNQLRRDLQEQDQAFSQQMERAKQSLSDGQPATSEVTNVANTIRTSANYWSKQADAMQNFLTEWGDDADEQWGGDIRKDMENMHKKASKAHSLAARAAARSDNLESIITDYDELLGIEVEDPGGEGGDGDIIVSPEQLTEYAEQFTGGNEEEAARILRNRGAQINR